MAAGNGLKISFCITCRGSDYLGRLQQTLPENLKRNIGAGHHGNVEFVIVAYGDPAVTQWLKENYAPEIKSGLLRAVDLPQDQAEFFKMAHAKNISHRMATGDVLCNLDCDNITGENFSGWLNEHFSKNRNILVCATTWDKLVRRLMTGKHCGDITGRIALSRENFERLHGYDEGHNAAKDGDDTNLKERAYALGVTCVSLPQLQFGQVIPHSNESRYAYMSPEDKQKSAANFNRAVLPTRWGTINRIVWGEDRVIPQHLPGANPTGEYGVSQVTILDENLESKPHSLGRASHPQWQPSYEMATPVKTLAVRG